MKEYTNLCKLLRKKGANPDIPDKSRETTHHIAAFDGHANVAKLLVKQVADIAAIDGYRQSPLSGAIELLFGKGANTAVENK